MNKRLTNLGAKGSLSPNASRRIGVVNRSLVARTGSPVVANTSAHGGFPFTNSVLSHQNSKKTPKQDSKNKKKGIHYSEAMNVNSRNQHLPAISKLSDDSAPSTENSRSDCDASDDEDDNAITQLGPVKATVGPSNLNGFNSGILGSTTLQTGGATRKGIMTRR